MASIMRSAPFRSLRHCRCFAAGTQSSVGSGTCILACSGLGAAGLLWLQQEPPYRSSLPELPDFQVPGARVHPRLSLREGGRGRGLFLDASVPAGTLLLAVPAEAVISPKRAKDVVSVGEEYALAALLARSRGEGGKLAGYVASLPREFPSVPLALEPEVAERELAGTALLPAAQELRARLLAERDAVKEKHGGAWPDEGWIWASCVLQTRGGLGLSLEGEEYALEKPALALVPLLDMANCEASSPSCEVRRGDKGEVCLVSARHMASGEEATFDYGTQDPEQCLFTFGYLPSAPLSASSPLVLSGDGLPGALLQLLALQTDSPAARLRRRTGGVDISELVTAANVAEMAGEDLKALASEAAAAGALPERLGLEASPGAKAALQGLLHAWLMELRPLAEGEGGDLADLRRYRAECAKLVSGALQQLGAP